MRRFLMKKFLLLNILAMLIFISAIATVTAEGSQDKKASQTGAPVVLDRVVLQLKWFHQFQFAGYYVALDKERGRINFHVPKPRKDESLINDSVDLLRF